MINVGKLLPLGLVFFLAEGCSLLNTSWSPPNEPDFVKNIRTKETSADCTGNESIALCNYLDKVPDYEWIYVDVEEGFPIFGEYFYVSNIRSSPFSSSAQNYDTMRITIGNSNKESGAVNYTIETSITDSRVDCSTSPPKSETMKNGYWTDYRPNNGRMVSSVKSFDEYYNIIKNQKYYVTDNLSKETLKSIYEGQVRMEKGITQANLANWICSNKAK